MDLEQQLRENLLADIKADRMLLPTLPEVALRIGEALRDPDISARGLASTLSTDAAISARLIKVANSALFRGRSTVTDLQTAVARLGLNLVRNMTTAMATEQMFQATSEVTDRWLRHVWQHSTEVAAFSRAMAGNFTRLNPEVAMMAGLTHDIGVLPIVTWAEENWAERESPLIDNEDILRKLIGELHGELGRAILETWGFPPEVVAVAAEHENLSRTSGPKPDYVDVVMVANLQSYVGTDHPHARVDHAQVPAYAKLGMAPETETVQIDEISSDIEETRQFFE